MGSVGCDRIFCLCFYFDPIRMRREISLQHTFALLLKRHGGEIHQSSFVNGQVCTAFFFKRRRCVNHLQFADRFLGIEIFITVIHPCRNRPRYCFLTNIKLHRLWIWRGFVNYLHGADTSGNLVAVASLQEKTDNGKYPSPLWG